MSEPTLPQNPKMELDLTTTMVWEPKSIDLAVQRLPADGTGLMRPDARQLFLILVEMRRAGKLISPESLYEELRRRGKIEELGGDTFVQSLSASWGGTDHSDYYTRTLAHLHARRLAIVLGQNLKQR
jgi:replicative DNA helicase